MMRAAATATLAAVICLVYVPHADANEPVPLDVVERSVSSAAARRMVDACLEFAGDRGWKIQVAVVDPGGALVAFGRSDGASNGSQDISLMKARTAASFAWSTEQFAQFGWTNDGQSPGPLALVPGTTGVGGGLPIFTPAGDHIGGIGVSGSLPANDAECAKSAIKNVNARFLLP